MVWSQQPRTRTFLVQGTRLRTISWTCLLLLFAAKVIIFLVSVTVQVSGSALKKTSGIDRTPDIRRYGFVPTHLSNDVCSNNNGKNNKFQDQQQRLRLFLGRCVNGSTFNSNEGNEMRTLDTSFGSNYNEPSNPIGLPSSLPVLLKKSLSTRSTRRDFLHQQSSSAVMVVVAAASLPTITTMSLRAEAAQASETATRSILEDNGKLDTDIMIDYDDADDSQVTAQTTTSEPDIISSRSIKNVQEDYMQQPLFETAGMIPRIYFQEKRYIYGYVERVSDGDTIRISHVPDYDPQRNDMVAVAEQLQAQQHFQKRVGSISDRTIAVRLYGIDAPEVAKNKNQITQPFGLDAKMYTYNSIYHKIVKVTILQKDKYGRVVGAVEAFNNKTGDHTTDLSIELAKRGLAEMYTGGGAQYWVCRPYIKNIYLIFSYCHSYFYILLHFFLRCCRIVKSNL